MVAAAKKFGRSFLREASFEKKKAMVEEFFQVWSTLLYCTAFFVRQNLEEYVCCDCIWTDQGVYARYGIVLRSVGFSWLKQAFGWLRLLWSSRKYVTNANMNEGYYDSSHQKLPTFRQIRSAHWTQLVNTEWRDGALPPSHHGVLASARQAFKNFPENAKRFIFQRSPTPNVHDSTWQSACVQR